MNIRQAILYVPLVLGLVVVLEGCVGLPLPHKTTFENIPKDSLTFLSEGETTKDEVRERLGKPSAAMDATNEWTYLLRHMVTGRWAFCFSTGAAVGSGCGVTEGTAKFQYLSIEFNDADVVTGWEKFKRK